MATVRQDAGAGFGKWGAGLREGIGSKAPDYGRGVLTAQAALPSEGGEGGP